MRLLQLCAALACVVIGWFGFAVAGWSGLIWSACAVMAFIALSARFAFVEPVHAAADEQPFRSHVGHYPQYDELATQVRWSLGDGRYFAHVLAPHLRDLAHDIAAHRRGRNVSDVHLASTLGAPVWDLLTPDPLSRDRDDVPSQAEIAQILSAIEGL
jgi:hypothetical protein